MECEFCNKNFTTMSNLRYHKKTNKKCQEIQSKDKDINEIVLESSVSCEFCRKNFTKQTIKVHDKICKKKLEFENKKRISGRL